jgi:hypothetical protein
MKQRGFFKISVALVLFMVLMLAVAACGEEDVDADQVVEVATEQMESGGDEIDACAIVTQDIATELFGDQAIQDEGTPVLDPNLMGECIWTWDTDLSNQLLQFRVWNGEVYYSETDGAEAIDLGDKGQIRVDDLGGIDITWVQDGNTVELSYFNIGPDVPEMQSKVQEMKDLAQQVSDDL